MKANHATIPAQQLIISIFAYLSNIFRAVTQTKLMAFGSGKIQHEGVYYNVIFHMVYQAPKKYTVKDIEAEAVIRFNLSKCLILDISDIQTKNLFRHNSPNILNQQVSDKIQYLQLT